MTPIALLPCEEGTASLLNESAARDLVADAYAHCKFIGYTEAVTPLFEKAAIADSLEMVVSRLSHLAIFWGSSKNWENALLGP